MAPPKADFLRLLRALAERRVEFIVVGGIAAILDGAAITTFDLDVVHRRTAENVDRLVSALESLHARYRGQGERVLTPDASTLAGPGHHLLVTDGGPLDLLGVIGAGRDYEALVPHSRSLPVDPGLEVLVLDLPTLIRTKEEAGREKDRAVLAILRRTLDHDPDSPP